MSYLLGEMMAQMLPLWILQFFHINSVEFSTRLGNERMKVLMMLNNYFKSSTTVKLKQKKTEEPSDEVHIIGKTGSILRSLHRFDLELF